jgi:thioredoxin-like negative regulator of GroEL
MKTITAGEIEPKVLRAAAPVALDFYQATCAPCRALEPRLEHVADSYRDRLAVYRVDAEHDLSLAVRFGVTSIPTVLILRGGKEIERLDDLISESDLKTAFDKALAAESGGRA